jgi:hypothetical protein
MRILPALCLAIFGAISAAHADPISVGNFVWEDRDADGLQDGGEPGLAGVVVQLWNSTKTQILDSDTTDAAGAYALLAPEPGSYRVRIVLTVADATFSTKDAGANDQLDSDINRSGGDIGFTDIYVFSSAVVSNQSIDAGIVLPIAVGNLVFDDLDRDGVQDAGDPGIAGVVVQLWNAAQNQILDTSTTNASGLYSLTAPGAGSYRVRVVPPAGATGFSPKDAGANDALDSDINPTGSNTGFTDILVLSATPASIDHIDAGIVYPRIDVGNFVWDDIDRDGLQDAGEPGIEGVLVQLWNGAITAVFDADTTDASGNYTLVAPGPGDYRVRVLLPDSDFGFSPKNQGGDTIDSDVNPTSPNFGFTDTYTWSSAVTATTSVDAGLIGPGLFSDGFE